MSDDNIRFTFNDTEEVGTEPDTSRLPAFRTFDPDPTVDAEIAVERGVATPEQEEYVEAMNAYRPLLVDTGNKIEAELTQEQARPLKAVGYVTDDKPDLANEDGTFTQLESAVPHPTRRKDQ